MESIEEGLALLSLNILPAEQIPELAMLMVSDGCDIPCMAALAGALNTDHPASLRAELERTLSLAGYSRPTRMSAACALRRIYAERGGSGVLPPSEAARLIIGIFHVIDEELPKSTHYLGESFDIHTLIGLYYSYDDIAYGDTQAVRYLDLELTRELVRLGRVPNSQMTPQPQPN